MSRTAYVITCIVLYSAIMLALAWGLWQVLPSAKDWVDGTFGKAVSAIIVFSIIPIGWGLSYLLSRKDSGRA